MCISTTPQAKGSYFGLEHLEQVITSYLHFTENRPSQAKPTLPLLTSQVVFTFIWAPLLSPIITTSSISTNSQSSNHGGSPSPPSPLTSPSPNTSTTVCKRIQSDDSSSLAPTGKLKWLEWNNNQKPTGHPKVHDYVPEIYHLIMLAIREFSVCVCTQNALPDPEVQITGLMRFGQTHAKWLRKSVRSLTVSSV